MNYSIRNMTEQDIHPVQHVARTSWNNTYEGIIPLEIQNNFLEAAYNDERMMQRLQHSHIFVAEADGQIVGFANFSPVNEAGKMELGAIYLFPAYQGNGIGTALLQKGITDLKGAKEIFINVERDNLVGKTFYEAKGFEVVSEFDDDFDGHILKTIRMVLNV
ncbi:GNAT family N-acetyltransferase [Virgibacillus oceani]|uniref:N-acetyltransferase n=1 Tax=Virgibacillus oceani TaxID=1479511 RepID=A0A917HFP1_9BACI|nr:GNAT family N-acetyltransferase [Virgibacillus oceani]GGG76567.1 N-acetyltransferase [Virgibacillus oceani]